MGENWAHVSFSVCVMFILCSLQKYTMGMVHEFSDHYRHLVVRVLQETKPLTHRGTGVVHRLQLLHGVQFEVQCAREVPLGR